MDAYGSCHCVGHYEFQVSLELLEVDSETGVWIIVASGTEALSLSLSSFWALQLHAMLP